MMKGFMIFLFRSSNEKKSCVNLARSRVVPMIDKPMDTCITKVPKNTLIFERSNRNYLLLKSNQRSGVFISTTVYVNESNQ